MGVINVFADYLRSKGWRNIKKCNLHCPKECDNPTCHRDYKIISLSVAKEDKLVMENVPSYYSDLKEVFGKDMQSELPKHSPQDIAINFLPDTELQGSKLYPMSQDEL